jgi:hypothetical protein
LDVAHAPSRLVEDFPEDFIFPGIPLLFRGEHLRFVLLQFLGDKPLGVRQSLPAQVPGGDQREIGLGHLDIISENPVVADLERGNARGQPFAAFQFRDPFFPVRGHVAQTVQVRVEPRPDQTAFLERGGRVVLDGPGEKVPQGSQIIPGGQPGLKNPPGKLGDQGAQFRQRFERVSEGDQVPGVGRSQGNPGRKSLQVPEAAVFLPDLFAEQIFFLHFRHGFKPRLDSLRIHQRGADPPFEQAAAHGGSGAVQNLQKGTSAAAGLQVFKELQVAPGGFVQHQVIPDPVKLDSGKMIRPGLLGLRNIKKQSPGGLERRLHFLPSLHAQPAKMLLGAVRGKNLFGKMGVSSAWGRFFSSCLTAGCPFPEAGIRISFGSMRKPSSMRD